MKAAILTIGDELLYGQTIDTNSAFLGRELLKSGYDPSLTETVGDDIEIIRESISRLFNEFDLVVATGGLGPTNDDITKKAICRAFKRNLILYDDVLKFIEDRFKKQNKEMPPSVQSQALLPQGCKVLQNHWGTAPGIMITEGKRIFVSLPGVPYEMKNLFIHQLKPILPPPPEGKTITFKRLKTSGMREAVIYDMVKDLLNERGAVNIAFLPSFTGVDIRLTVKNETRQKAEELLAQFEEKLKSRIGKYIYGEGEEANLPKAVAELLKSSQKTLSTAESCTGGLLAKLLTDIPGSSEYFERGVITYSNQAKIEILKVPEELINKFGAVSSQVAEAMAKGIRKLSDTDFSLSITGIAGPTGGTEEKPVGTTWIGIAFDDNIFTKKYLFNSDREINRQRAASAALNLLRRKLLGEDLK